MDMSSLGGMPGLLDFLNQGKNKTSVFDGVTQNLVAKIAKIQETANAATNNSGVNIKLSEQAQALLDSANGDNSALTGVQKAGQNFLMSFFDESGLNFSAMKDEALDLIEGLGAVVGGAAVTGRDITTDIAEEKYNADRKVYTMTGNGTRLRIGIDYGADGKPSKLSVTDISGGKVETAEITLTRENGKATNMVINRTQRAYENGHMVSLAEIDPLDIKLYAAS